MKRKILKEEKKNYGYKRTKIRITLDFSLEHTKTRREKSEYVTC